MDATTPAVFEERVKSSPDSVALSYRDLDARANRIARFLSEKERIRREEAVGVYMDRSVHQIEAVLGILKAGGAYVPLDPALPLKRIKHMMDDAVIGRVMDKSLALLAEEGRLFLGDIMDRDLKEEMVADLLRFKRENGEMGYNTKTDFTAELFLSRDFFHDEAKRRPEIINIEFSGKIHTIVNELTKYRYDVLMEADKRIRRKQRIQSKKVSGTPLKCQFDEGILDGLSDKALGKAIAANQLGANHLAYIIYTSGSPLARGYLNAPELTNKKFLRGAGAVFQKEPLPAGGSMLLHPTCTVLEVSDTTSLISNHYRVHEHRARQRQHAAAPYNGLGCCLEHGKSQKTLDRVHEHRARRRQHAAAPNLYGPGGFRCVEPHHKPLQGVPAWDPPEPACWFFGNS